MALHNAISQSDIARWRKGQKILEDWKTRRGNRTGSGIEDTAKRTTRVVNGVRWENRGQVCNYAGGNFNVR